MIETKEKLVKYIRSQLGEPLITIELTDGQISEVIDDTIDMYTEVVYGDFEQTLVLNKESLNDFFQMYLPKFVSILRIIHPGNTREPKLVNYVWSNISRTLTLTDDKIPQKMIVIALTRYEANDLGDYIFNESWVKAMAKAKTQKLWGHVVGKYSQSLVGGATINYDRLISEADSEIERLMEELHDKWVDPAPVLVG